MNFIFKRMLSALSALTVSASFCFSMAIGTVSGTSGEESGAAEKSDELSYSMAMPDFKYVLGSDGRRIEPMAPQSYLPKASVYSRGAALPSEFDLRDESGITSVKNQGSHGTCWAHSSAASAESGILSSNPTVDLSELHTAYFSYFGDDQLDAQGNELSDILNAGGNGHVVTNLWAQWIGPVAEEKLYGDAFIFNDSQRLEELKNDSDYHLENAYFFDYAPDKSNFNEVNNAVKSIVSSGQGVDVSFHSEQSGNYSYSYFTSNSNRPPRFADHAVTICGWDDNIPSDKFRNSPEGDGGWLVKNSWGAHYGDEGYFWISYYDKSLVDFGVYDLGDKNNYENNHQHDTFVYTNTMSAHMDASETEPSYMANVFNSAAGEEIQAISTYFNTPGTEYEVTVYSNLTNPADPTSGKGTVAASGVNTYTGYHTIDLDESVFVEAGDFSVVVKLYCPDTPFVIPIETSLYAESKSDGSIFDLGNFTTKERIEANTGKNESFYSPDGIHWGDAGCEIYQYSDEEKAILLENLETELFDGLLDSDTALRQEAQDLLDTYTSVFESSDLKIISGNISMKAFGSQKPDIEFSHISGEVPTNEQVSLSSDNGKQILVSLNGSEYVPYTQPISIMEKTTVSATYDGLTFIDRVYEPSVAQFFELCYINQIDRMTDTKSAKQISKSEYLIELKATDDYLRLYPVTDADIFMNGEKIEKYELTDDLGIGLGETEIVMNLSKENALDNEVHITIKKIPIQIDLEDELLKYAGADKVYTTDGTVIPHNSEIGAYAGQKVLITRGEVTIEYIIPERNVLPELKLDYYFETLGFIPNETAELLEYSVIENPVDNNYVSASERLVDGTWINSGMVMNKAFRVIPGEKLSLKVAAGNGKFASIPQEFVIPEAPEAPKTVPEYTIDGDYVRIDDFSYEIAAPNPTEGDTIGTVYQKWGYFDKSKFESLMKTRMNAPDRDTILDYINAIWDVSVNCNEVNKIAVRYTATDTSFASKSIYISLDGDSVLKGDADGDGIITASDATLVLRHYTSISAGGGGILTGKSLEAADFDNDGIITGSDATMILMLYTQIASG